MLEKVKQTVNETFWYSIGNMAVKLSGLILLPLYSKYLPIAIYGLLALFEISSEILFSISSFGVERALKRFYWDEEMQGKQKSLYFTTFIFSLISSSIFLLAMYFVLYHFSMPIFDLQVSKSLITLFLGMNLAKILFNNSLLILRMKQQVVKQTRFMILNLIISVGFIVGLITFTSLGLEAIFIAQIISYLVIFILLLPATIRNFEFKFEGKLLTEMLNFSYPLALSSLLSLIFTLSDRYILRLYYGLESVGQYSVSYKISSVIKLVVVRSFSQAYVYLYYRNMADKAGRFFRKILTYYSYLACLLSLALSLFAKEIISTFTVNNDYTEAWKIIPLLTFGMIFAGMRQILIMPVNKHKKSKTNSAILVSAGLLNIILNFIFIPHWQAVGAAFATVLTQFVTVIFYLILVEKLDDVRYEYKKIFMIFGLSLLLFQISYLIADLNIWLRITVKLLILMSFPFILRLIKFYEEIELEKIEKGWNKWKRPSHWKENLTNRRDK